MLLVHKYLCVPTSMQHQGEETQQNSKFWFCFSSSPTLLCSCLVAATCMCFCSLLPAMYHYQPYLLVHPLQVVHAIWYKCLPSNNIYGSNQFICCLTQSVWYAYNMIITTSMFFKKKVCGYLNGYGSANRVSHLCFVLITELKIPLPAP